MERIFETASVVETEELGKSLAQELCSTDFIALYGELGAGKTAFVRGVVRGLMPTAEPLVHSPTYAIVNEYRADGMTVYHFDMYRICSEEELYAVGFYELADTGITICEWCENIEYAIPENAIHIDITKTGESTRKITVRKND